MADGDDHADMALPPVLDTAQLVRIEAVHRGYFYQHLYAVQLLFGMQGRDIVSVSVERDEDIELREEGKTSYIQVKTRGRPIVPSDLTKVLARFDTLRKDHADGKRIGSASFSIVANAEPSPLLLQQLSAKDWPRDVEFVSPGRPSSNGLPLPATTVAGAIANGETAAASVPFGSLSPANLVLKLAAIVQWRSSGAGNHVITASELVLMLDQIVAQLHDFPEPPRPYYPQEDEPPILSDQRVRMIIGFSGAGKTSWAAEAARHRSEPIAYFDAAGLPSASVASNLARELVARFVGSATGAPRLAPGAGLELLRSADRLLVEQETRALVVLDNVHELSVDDLKRVVEAAPNTSFLALGQPWPERALAEAQLNVEAEELRGYGPDAVAAVFATADVAIDLEGANGILALTGGLPLYVANAEQLTASHHDGDVDAFISSIRGQTQLVDTAQALILERNFAALSDKARDVAAFLGLCDVPITNDEAMAYLGDVGTPVQIAAALRELRRSSMIRTAPGGLSLHDALRALAVAHASLMDDDRIVDALTLLRAMLMQSLRQSANIPRLTFLVRLLPKVGQTDALVELATSEMFYEQGNHSIVFETLLAAAADETAGPVDRFWAMDAVAYWQSRDGGTPDRALVERMAALVASHPEFENRERSNLLFKQLVIAGSDGDRREIDRLSETGRRLTKGRSMESRIFRHNRALALYRAGAFDAVRKTTEPLIDDMFKALGFPEHRLVGSNGPALGELLQSVEEFDDIKRTADVLNLWASTVAKTGQLPGLRRIQATKLFNAAGAGRSAVSSAMDAVEDTLLFMADAEHARAITEQHILPLIERYGLTDLDHEARSLYAVVLAWNGDFEAADREMAILSNFGGAAARAREFGRQASLIEAIRTGQTELTPIPRQDRGKHLIRQPNLIGRKIRPDNPCPCGSGRKYKRCHGRS
ncbi:hypothetical protein E5675_16200 [Sphingopyxis sp. PAMC25046]|uniref:SEC-C metal-binding domain-containing protein n=1 Tax=Sphingopyxis sp. PAMC25046 TaxID=2565556 RepID=UPI00109E1105|nr:SEC-C metal-binding domain-containing protein [Sphingopyxis sp. PAMC25046]QCB55821.1 hypothetical protein E5675_16200 [Sphingopyxis sp. PAMC25046]